MSSVGIVGAFLAGIASLLSPCSALLLPSFFAYAFDRIQALISRTIAFWLGLCLILVPIGAGIGAVGSAVTRYRSEVTVIGGVVIIAFGAMTLLGKGFGVPGAQRLTARIKISTTLSVVALGAVYGLAGFCAGPLLGAVLTASAMGANPIYGALLMSVFALGMAAPLFVLAICWERFDLAHRSWLRGRPVRLGPVHTHTTALLSGLIMMAFGTLFLLTDGTANLGGIFSVDAAYDVQLWLGRLASTMSGPAIALGIVLLLLIWRGYRTLRRIHRGRKSQGLNTAGTR